MQLHSQPEDAIPTYFLLRRNYDKLSVQIFQCITIVQSIISVGWIQNAADGRDRPGDDMNSI